MKSMVSTATKTTTKPNENYNNNNKMSAIRFHPPKPKVAALNKIFTCQLCQGYMINPTAIDTCVHTFCRSCIVRQLAVDCFCPQCNKQNDAKPITVANLKSDDILRTVIYKLVPGLYQAERERLVQYLNNAKNKQSLTESIEPEDDLFTPCEPISLSLEYHPILLKQCSKNSLPPPVRYLECPASLQMQHLKRFLYTKFDLDPANKLVDIEVMYEDEILPNDFTLMDVAYCYQWKRHAPMKFFYRILVYAEESSEETKMLSKQTLKPCSITSTEDSIKAITTHTQKLAISTGSEAAPTAAEKTKVKIESSVKLTLNRSCSKESKKSKKSVKQEFFEPLHTSSDFKSLRSNDIRYSDYSVSSSSSSNSSPTGIKFKDKSAAIKEEKFTPAAGAKCDIVVSIPHNQMQEEWETKPLAQLKTASKKSPTSAFGTANCFAQEKSTKPAKSRNVPKLKIELNSLRSKLIEKPKSADIRLDTLLIKKTQQRPRRFSLEEPSGPLADKVDLETYIKNIGLKPIEVQTNADVDHSEKYTPNASPMSSCSSSTTNSSSNGNFNFNANAEKAAISCSSSSSSGHKKRKKKHSRDSKEPGEKCKRKKLHAEISSHSAEESLKMKVKLTSAHSSKAIKAEAKKQRDLLLEKAKLSEFRPLLPAPEKKIPKVAIPKLHHDKKDKYKCSEHKAPKIKEPKEVLIKPKTLEIPTKKPDAPGTNLFPKDFDDEDLLLAESNSAAGQTTLSKPLSNLMDSTIRLPNSPPLPPSLFKTTPSNFNSLSSTLSMMPKPVAKAKEKSKASYLKLMKPIAPKPTAAKSVFGKSPTQFVVPSPPRLIAPHAGKYYGAPTSIASNASKHMGHFLKRSASLDESKSQKKLIKVDSRPQKITVSAYGSNSMVSIPATPTSSTAKATYEIPLYSPLSASYNPACSLQKPFTTSASSAVYSSTFSASPRVSIQNSITLTAPASIASKANFVIANNNKAEKEGKKAALMGPPLPKSTNSQPKDAPTTVKSPPLVAASKLPVSTTTTATTSVSLNLRPNIPTLATPKAADMKLDALKTNGVAASEAKNSLRTFRLPSRESMGASADILDLSSNAVKAAEASKKPTNITTTTTTSLTNSSSSLELALNKIKQNLTSTTAADNVNAIKKRELSPNSDDLQNLQLLSESALARERISIKSNNVLGAASIAPSTATTLSSTSPTSPASLSPSSLYDKPKILQNTLVRHQNASVRNIPNPSALAFRNQQLPPMVTIAVPLQNTTENDIKFDLKTTNSASNATTLAAVKSCSFSPNATSGSSSTVYSTSRSLTTSNCSTSAAAGSLHTATGNKKHASIDQVAANLNIKAKAAAEASTKASTMSNATATAKSSSSSPSSTSRQRDMVTSTSSLLTTDNQPELQQQQQQQKNLQSKEIKQEQCELATTTTADKHIETAAALPTSTTNNCSSSSNCSANANSSISLELKEIKKEPEDKLEESTAFSSSTNPLELADRPDITLRTSSSSLGERLVTSVINVTAPTSSMLTTTSVAY